MITSEPTTPPIVASTDHANTVEKMTDADKKNLLTMALDNCATEIIALVPDDKLLQTETLKYFSENLAIFIEEVCETEAANGQNQCLQLFVDIKKNLRETKAQGLESVVRLAHLQAFLRQKVAPLYLARAQRMGMSAETATFMQGRIQQAQKGFMAGRRSQFLGIADEYLPNWFAQEARQARYEKLISAAALGDPEAQKIHRLVRERVEADLRLEE